MAQHGEGVAHHTVVFRKDTHGYAYFRIPALMEAGGVLYAFAEGRRDGMGDSGRIDVMLSISHDYGWNWSEPRLIWKRKSHTCGNPVPVFDRARDRIVLVGCTNRSTDTEDRILAGEAKDTRRAWVLFSALDGSGFRKPREITEHIKSADGTWFAAGPGGGIRLSSGRILVPLNEVERGHRVDTGGRAHVGWSDDGGRTWSRSSVAVPGGGNEAHLADMGDGSLILSARYHGETGPAHRFALSWDGGANWAPLTCDVPPVSLRCKASMVAPEPGRLLFLAPSATQMGLRSRTLRRSRLALSESLDRGRTWRERRVIDPGLAAYSDMIRVAGGIGMLWERGEDTPYDEIAFSLIRV